MSDIHALHSEGEGSLTPSGSPAAPSPADVYLTRIRREASRVLSLMDREQLSPTFGCMDRTYWAWKFTDFPGARFQEGLCALGFLFSHEHEDNPFYQNPKLLDWIAGGFDFWTKIQYGGGDFDEAYPFEHSLAATAFTSFYLSEAWNFVSHSLPDETSSRFKRTLSKAADWLVRNDEKHGFLSNHLAAAGTALYHAYRICGDDRFEKRSRHFIDKVLDHQSDEGWYEEYGGADPGYQTHGSFYLARYLELSGDVRLIDSLEKSFGFLAHFVHPDGSLGGEYTSRNTQTYYPAAFEMMSGKSGRAHWIAATQIPAVLRLSAACLGTVDIYNLFPLLNNYVFAYLACRAEGHRSARPEPPPSEPGVTVFPKAGVVKVRKERYELYIGTGKGGVLKAFDREKKRLFLNDCGYLGKTRKGKFFSSQVISKNWKQTVSETEIVIEGPFSQVSKPLMTPFSFLLFRTFNMTFGRLRAISYWLKSLLVKVLIYRKKEMSLRLQRRVTLEPDRIVVRDLIKGPDGDAIESLYWMDVFTTIHMGSSRYFIPNELDPFKEPEQARRVEVDTSGIGDGIAVERSSSVL